MDNQPWDKAKLEEWKKFWKSEMGQEALNKMQDLKERCLNFSMDQTDSGAAMAYLGRAAGIDLVLQDIQAGFNALEELGKEEKEKK